MLSFAGEAAHLAADFDYVCESEFPAAQLAERQYRQHAEPSQQQSRKNAIIAAKYVLLCYLIVLIPSGYLLLCKNVKSTYEPSGPSGRSLSCFL